MVTVSAREVQQILHEWCGPLESHVRLEDAEFRRHFRPTQWLVLRLVHRPPLQSEDSTSNPAPRKSRRVGNKAFPSQANINRSPYLKQWVTAIQRQLDAIQVLLFLMRLVPCMDAQAQQHIVDFLGAMTISQSKQAMIQESKKHARNQRPKDDTWAPAFHDPTQQHAVWAMTSDEDRGLGSVHGLVLDFAGWEVLPEAIFQAVGQVLRCSTSRIDEANAEPLRRAVQIARSADSGVSEILDRVIPVDLRFWNCKLNASSLDLIHRHLVHCRTPEMSSPATSSSSLTSSPASKAAYSRLFVVQILDLSSNVLNRDAIRQITSSTLSAGNNVAGCLSCVKLNGVCCDDVDPDATLSLMTAIFSPVLDGDGSAHRMQEIAFGDNALTWQQLACLGSLLHTVPCPTEAKRRLGLSRLQPPLSIDKETMWQWLMFAVFHPLSRAGIKELDLSGNGLEVSDVYAAQRALRLAQPPRDVWYDEPFLSEYKLPQDERDRRDQDVSTLSESEGDDFAEYVRVSSKATFRSRPTRASRKLNCVVADNRESWFPVVDRQHDCVCVMLPGVGYAWVHPPSAVIETQTREMPPDGVHSVRALKLDFMVSSGMGHTYEPSLMELVNGMLQLIGHPLTSLSLRGNYMKSEDVVQVMDLCPNLESLDLQGCSLVDIGGLVLTLRRRERCAHLRHLNLRYNLFSSIDLNLLTELENSVQEMEVWY